jgi:transcriptional regulator with XRE-family HTH domain
MPRRNPNAATPEQISEELIALGGRIRQQREQLDLDQTSCGRSLGVLPSTWNRWERGSKTADALVLARWCALVGGSMDFLYCGRLTGISNAALALRLAQLNPREAQAQVGGMLGGSTRAGRPSRAQRVAA